MPAATSASPPASISERAGRVRTPRTLPLGASAPEVKARHKRDGSDIEIAVLSALAGADRPLTAYAVQERAAVAGQRLYPTQVYRAMRRLVEAGQVHRVETANAYMLRHSDSDTIALCEICGRAFAYRLGRPLEDILAALEARGFAVKHLSVEAVVCCAACGD
ncbi:Fur family transcriptional regulator [Sphingopyxis panaciterrae]